MAHDYKSPTTNSDGPTSLSKIQPKIQPVIKPVLQAKVISKTGAKENVVNNDSSLEHEADVMGKKASQGLSAEVSHKGAGIQLKRADRFTEDTNLDKVSDGTLNLKIGSHGVHVRKVQNALAELGLLTATDVTGNYDQKTADAVKAFQRSKSIQVDGMVGPGTMEQLDIAFTGFSVEHQQATTTDPVDLMKGTRTLDATDRTEVARLISTQVQANPTTGVLPTFTQVIVGKGDYRDRVYAKAEEILLLQYERLGKGKEAERKDPNNLHDWNDIGKVGERSAEETDKVFGTYKKGTPLKPNVNIFDGWEDKTAKLSVSTAAQDAAAEWRVQKIVEGSSQVAEIDREHGAIQSRGPESAIVRGVITALALKYRFELIETHKGWPGYADGGNIYLQRYKSLDMAENRNYMWDQFQTIIHEYIHTLEHPDQEAYRNTLSDKDGGKTMREGITDYFTKTVWSGINTGDVTLRKTIEGPYHNPLAPTSHPIPALHTYSEAINAERLAGLVGFRNLCAAFFLGKSELIGKV